MCSSKLNATPREVSEARRIVECAVSAGSDYIVTGDKDLPRPNQFDSIRILTVSDFLDIARARRTKSGKIVT